VLDRPSEANQASAPSRGLGSSPLRLPRFHDNPVEGVFKVKRGGKCTRSEDEREKAPGKGNGERW
jgi:hypothetical protein